MSEAGLTPDPWQADFLRSTSDRILLCCSRQSGKSRTSAALALWTALVQAPALVLLLSPSLRQSGELFRKVLDYINWLPHEIPIAAESALRIELENGSRIVSLPGAEATIRGFSAVDLLLVDEGSRCLDSLYYSVRPVLAVSQGRLVVLSTPFGRRGFFWQEWDKGEGWERIRITADQCPRIPQDFLDQERKALGERWYKQEYLCSFEDCVGSVFNHEDIQRAFVDDGEVWEIDWPL